jgi:hypothetical protein
VGNNLAEGLLTGAALALYAVALSVFLGPRLNRRAQKNRELISQGQPDPMTPDDAWELWGAPTMEKLSVGIPLAAGASLFAFGVDVPGNPLTVNSLIDWIAGTVATVVWCNGFFRLLSDHHSRTAFFPTPKVDLDATARKVTMYSLLAGAAVSAVVWTINSLI